MMRNLGQTPVRVTRKHGPWSTAVAALTEYEPYNHDEQVRRDLILAAFDAAPDDARHVTLTASDVYLLMNCLSELDQGGEPAAVMIRSLRVSAETAMRDAREHGERRQAAA